MVKYRTSIHVQINIYQCLHLLVYIYSSYILTTAGGTHPFYNFMWR